MSNCRDGNDVLREEGEDAVRAMFDKAEKYKAAPGPDARSHITVEAWLRRPPPQRDYLFDGVMCTTSRWIINGETGVGKTLLGLELGFAAAAAADFLSWKGVRRCRVMYLDGEMPAETLQERIKAAADVYGTVDLYAYNRDGLCEGEMPPLNSDAGQAWLWREIDLVAPDLLIGDSLMCLLAGSLSEEEPWLPMKALVRRISARRIAQIWLHHTGHDTSRGFGTKTREWEMDTVAMLSKREDNDALTLEFTKARLRTPSTAAMFKPQAIRREAEGWRSTGATKADNKPRTAAERKRTWFREIYFELAADVPETAGYNSTLVRKVALEAIRRGMVSRGFLETENGRVPPAERSAFKRAKEELVASQKFTATELQFWQVP